MKSLFLKIIIILIILQNNLLANTQLFQQGLNFFKDKKFNEAKFKFEQDIVLNPKSEMSYLYLAKIFQNLDNKDLQEQNLNTVILLNPKNEEAIYDLAKLKLSVSDYKKSKELSKKLEDLCVLLCIKSQKLKIEIENLSKK